MKWYLLSRMEVLPFLRCWMPPQWIRRVFTLFRSHSHTRHVKNA
jgi:hypothetical protein